MSKTRIDFDVAIIGTGPAGMFSAIEIARRCPNASMVLFEKGPRRGFGDTGNETCGLGGAGAFSDGKLDLTHKVGGILVEGGYVSETDFYALMRYVEDVYLSYCRDAETVVEVDNNPGVERIRALCVKHNLELIPFPVRHLGTDRSFWIVEGIFNELQRAGAEVRIQTEVTRVDKIDGGFLLKWQEWENQVVVEDEVLKKKRSVCAEGEVFVRKVVVCPGREGDHWFSGETRRLGLTVFKNRVDIGVRVEVPHSAMSHLTDVLHEPKIIYYTPTFKDRVRTFCVCPHGFVTAEPYHGLPVITVNGKADSEHGRRTASTNFALLVSQAFTKPFDDPVDYAVATAQKANRLAGPNGVLVQRLGDVGMHRSTEERIQESKEYGFVEQTLADATPGDLTLVVPYRHFVGVLEMLKALSWIAPGITSPHTLLYGVEVKFYSLQVKTRSGFETEIDGLYVAGDGSGYTRGLLQSSIQGVIVARDIAAKL